MKRAAVGLALLLSACGNPQRFSSTAQACRTACAPHSWAYGRGDCWCFAVLGTEAAR